MKVWDRGVRIGHWALAAAVLLSWATREGWGRWHEWLGYSALTLTALRVVWGVTGTRYARFAQFLRTPRTTLAYARDVLSGRERRYLGHNPLGGWMALLLLAFVIATGLSGWLYTTDTYWGVEWVERLHGGASDLLLACIALHLAGVTFTSFRQRENLVKAMLNGRKRDAAGNDVV